MVFGSELLFFFLIEASVGPFDIDLFTTSINVEFRYIGVHILLNFDMLVRLFRYVEYGSSTA